MFRYLPLVLVFVPNVVEARPVRILTYQQLFHEASVVIIGTATSERDAENGDESEYHIEVPIVTTFKVHLVLKGEVESESVEFLHYRYKKGLNVVVNAPNLVCFEISGPRGGRGLRDIQKYTPTPSKYLLFLKCRSDGQLEAVTRDDPLYSVKKLAPPDRLDLSNKREERFLRDLTP